jgi:thiamine kinase-like enzyme
MEMIEQMVELALGVAGVGLLPLERDCGTSKRFAGVVTPVLRPFPSASRVWEQLLRRISATPKFLGHGDFHSRNVVVDGSTGRLSLVDLQDVGPAPYALDVAMLSVDPNYQSLLLPTDRLARLVRKYARTDRQCRVVASRDVDADILDAQLAQLVRLIVVCRHLAAAGKGVSFEIEAERSLAKLQLLAPPAFETVAAVLADGRSTD